MLKLLARCLRMTLLLPALVLAADQPKTMDGPSSDPSFLGYVPDEFIVVLKPDAGEFGARSASGTRVHVGNPGLDGLADRFAVSGIRRQFPGVESDTRSSGGDLAAYHKVRIGSGMLEEAMAAYRNHPWVERVEPIGIHAMYAMPNDPDFATLQWYQSQASDHDVDSPEAWDLETGDSTVIVAIIDSGTRYYHPDLGGALASWSNPGASRGNMWVNQAELSGAAGVDDDGNGYVDDWIGYDFVDGAGHCWPGEDCGTKDNDPRDFNGHGTHTAGIVGMLTNDGYGMAGVAGGWGSGTPAVRGNGASIMALRAGYSYDYQGKEQGVVTMDAAAEALYYAARNGARIACCSWGSSNSGGLGAAVDYFIEQGGLTVVAAGNDGTQTADYLNGRGDCISVAATDESDNAASFTRYGTWVDICAPGQHIYATDHDHINPMANGWTARSGTSMAAPMAAATAALIWSHYGTWTAKLVRSRLYESADNIDASLAAPSLGRMGAGRVNAHTALSMGPTPAGSLPEEFGADQNYPNPFNPSTKIGFRLARAGQVELTVYNVLGQIVARLADTHYDAGEYELVWNASGMASGVYFYRLRAGDETAVRSMMLLK